MKNEFDLEIMIFYDRSSWDRLLKNFIQPYLSKQKDIESIKNFGVTLALDRGDHIKLTLYSVNNVNSIKQDLEKQLGTFLKKHPSTKEIKEEFPVKKFFKDFENNSFLFMRNKFNGIDIHFRELIEGLSSCIIYAISLETCDLDLILSTMFYMQLGLINTAFPKIHTSISHMNFLVDYISKYALDHDNIEGSNSSIQSLSISSDNQGILLQIIDDVQSGNYSEDLCWMKTWKDLCAKYLCYQSFEGAYLDISKSIHHHLGLINDKDILFISSNLILNALKSRSVSNLSSFNSTSNGEV